MAEHEIRERSDCGIVEVVLHGDLTVSEAQELCKRTAQICREKGYQHILVNAHHAKASLVGSTMDVHWLGSQGLQDIGFSAATRVALTIRTDHSGSKDWHFLATVERNRGLSVKLFGNRNDALHWLTG